MKEFLVYTLLRLALLVGAFAIVYGVWAAVTDQVSGESLVVILLIAFVVSGVGSYFLLNPQREAFARRVEERARKASDRFEKQRSKEDQA